MEVSARTTIFFSIFFTVFPDVYQGQTLPDSIIQEIRGHQGDIRRIVDYVRNGPMKHKTYERLANLTDTFGHRMTGSKALEDAIDFVAAEMAREGIENIALENVTVPYWKRGQEFATLIEPRLHDIYIMSLGSSVGTPPEGITAEAIVVRSFDELSERKEEVSGKIVVYNAEWRGYGGTVPYRAVGATEAARYGAVAALAVSATQFSVYSPHTGGQIYEEGITKIPAACLTIEDAQMLHRIHMRGQRIVINMTIGSSAEGPDIISRNVIGDLTGSKYPDQYVILGGHIDSWDVGTGAMDDAGGVVISWQALSVLKALNLRPKRTMRVVGWTAEEVGLYGGDQFYERHKNISDRVSWILESDSGTFKPYGIGFSGNMTARLIIGEILSMLSEINTTTVGVSGSGPDIRFWYSDSGVPSGNLLNYNQDYFIFHHTHGDTMTVEDPDDLDLCTIVWTVATYVVANMEDMLPRTNLGIISSSSQKCYPSWTLYYILALMLFILQ